MTIEIADRLIKLRKKHGLSQEDLADKLGLSRQAVSKWERAEASPDTDNLICLAKLYGVSLDELLSTDEDVDTIVKEQVKKEDSDKDTIKLTDDEGQTLLVKDHHIHAYDKNGNEVKKGVYKDKFEKTLAVIDCALTTLTLVVYIFLGVFAKWWAQGWVFFFLPEIICSVIRAIHRKNPNKVNVTFIALFAFFFVCMVVPGLEAHLWHPMWVVFLLIPAYHSLFGAINKARGKEEDEDKE